MLEHRRYELLLEAVEPIAHASETFGNTSIFMRRKTRQLDGSFVSTPIVTGDTMRHGMREAAAYALLDAAGLLENPSLTEAALRLLFAGGMITGKGDASTVKLDDYRKLVEMVPSVALFGGCAGNRCIPGKLQVSDAVLVCEETWHLMPAWVRDHFASTKQRVDTHRSHIEEVQRVRMDPSLVPAKRQLLTDGERSRIEGRLIASESASDAVETEAAKSSMMPRRHETLVCGSLLYWSVSAVCHSALEADTFLVSLGAFLSNAKVGGKRGSGHGLLRPITGKVVEIARPLENVTTLDAGSLAPRVGELFRAHVKERASAVAEYLRSVDA